MPILTSNVAPSVAVDPRVANTLWQWLALGVVAVALLPAARGDSHLLGALPFWLLVFPSIGLVTLYRHTLAAAWRASLVRVTPRRRRRTAAVRVARMTRSPAPAIRPARRIA